MKMPKPKTVPVEKTPSQLAAEKAKYATTTTYGKDAFPRTKAEFTQFGYEPVSGSYAQGNALYKRKGESGKDEYFYFGDLPRTKGATDYWGMFPTSNPNAVPVVQQPPTTTTINKQPITLNPPSIEQPRKPVEFGTAGVYNPNTNTNYTTGIMNEKNPPIVNQYKNGGMIGSGLSKAIKGYAYGTDPNGIPDPKNSSIPTPTPTPTPTQTGFQKAFKNTDGSTNYGATSDVAGSILGIGTSFADAAAQKAAASEINDDGSINKGQVKKAAEISAASKGAQIGAIGLNPALMTATGGLSALAVPVGAAIGYGVGNMTGNKKANKLENEYLLTKEQEEKDRLNAQADLSRRKQMQTQVNTNTGFKDGGEIKGKGTAKSDSIHAKVKPGSFVVPAENADKAEAMRKMMMMKPPAKKKANLDQDGGEHVMLSNGEHLFTPKEKEKIISYFGHEMLEALAPNAEQEADEMKDGGLTSGKAKIILKDGTIRGHALTDKQKKFFGYIAGGGKVDGYKDGGEVGYKKGGPVNPVTSKQPLTETTTSKKKTLPVPKTTTYTRSKSVKQPVNNNSNVFKPNVTEADYESSAPEMAKSQDAKPLTENEKKLQKTAMDAEMTNFTTPSGKKGLSSEQMMGIFDQAKGIGSGLANYILPYTQYQMGNKFLAKAGARPIDQVDPGFQASVDRANVNAQFGFSPEERAAINMQNIDLLNAQKAAARNYSGGSGGNAYNMERDASNQAFGRGLQAAIENRQLQLGKQSYADKMNMAKADKSRQLFDDKLNAWNQNQQAGAGLIGSGIRNAVSANRYNAELNAMRQAGNFENSWMNNI